jgi:hypothetical protein
VTVLCEHTPVARPGFASVFAFGSFGTLLRPRGLWRGHGGVSWTSQQDTLQGADVYGSKEVNCRCPPSLIIAYLLGEEMGFV